MVAINLVHLSPYYFNTFFSLVDLWDLNQGAYLVERKITCFMRVETFKIVAASIIAAF